VGGGSNAIGLFQGFLDDNPDNNSVELVGCEAGGFGPGKGNHASRLAYKDASVGVAQGYKTFFLQNDDGNMLHTHSVAAGLDYIGVNPILVDQWKKGRIRFEAVTDDEVTQALKLTMETEGLIPALESCHAFAQAVKEAPKMSPDESILINMSGRGDKDIFTVADALDDEKWREFICQKAKEYED
ncbi:MAG: pyridoxal-phosphate dependent enzyme, partial [Proteobacteria bacterium]|nr:pyridoxal-phosphate dependent enzyme [Pseudomonadota bacterium]